MPITKVALNTTELPAMIPLPSIQPSVDRSVAEANGPQNNEQQNQASQGLRQALSSGKPNEIDRAFDQVCNLFKAKVLSREEVVAILARDVVDPQNCPMLNPGRTSPSAIVAYMKNLGRLCDEHVLSADDAFQILTDGEEQDRVTPCELVLQGEAGQIKALGDGLRNLVSNKHLTGDQIRRILVADHELHPLRKCMVEGKNNAARVGAWTSLLETGAKAKCFSPSEAFNVLTSPRSPKGYTRPLIDLAFIRAKKDVVEAIVDAVNRLSACRPKETGAVDGPTVFKVMTPYLDRAMFTVRKDPSGDHPTLDRINEVREAWKKTAGSAEVR
ncbi:hypothetical protein [Roseateles sp. MS654]|uniref:hypothetical protein n=1 Tax=Roseateles sp. MS654 TaxID=3412685 RepID=UPI003C30A27A